MIHCLMIYNICCRKFKKRYLLVLEYKNIILIELIIIYNENMPKNKTIFLYTKMIAIFNDNLMG